MNVPLPEAISTKTGHDGSTNMTSGQTLMVAPVPGTTQPTRAAALAGEVASMNTTKAVADLMAAIDLLPPDKIRSFLKAKTLCPNLVEVETTPSLFLQHDNFNYWKAADRLASHWAEREKIFGERAFLPMTQTGNGALTREDVVTLHTGSHARLPQTPAGQPVIFTDRRRILSTSHRESRTRCFWYMTFRMAREESASRLGVLFLVLLVTPRPTSLDFAYMQRGIDILNIMPATFHMHLLNNVAKTGKVSVAQKVIQSVVSYCLEYFGGLNVYTETCQGDLRDKLQRLGCRPEGLPSSVGGTWKYEEFTKWCRSHITEETCFEEMHLPRSKTEGIGGMTAERKKQRTKCLNVLHSRQKRERRKAEQQKMQDDCNQMQAEHWALQREHARLEGLLAQARELVAQFEGNKRLQASVGLPNSFEPIPSNAFSSTIPMEPQLTPNMQGDQMQAMLMNSFAMQQCLNQPSVGESLKHTMAASVQHSLNRVSSHANQIPMTQPGMDQHAVQQQLRSQQSTQPIGSMFQNTPTNQTVEQSTIQTDLNLSLQQAVMQAIGVQVQNSFNPAVDQTVNQPSHPTSRGHHRTMSQNQVNTNAPPNIKASSVDALAPAPLEAPDADPFAPLDAHIDSIVPGATTPAPMYATVNQTTSLRESVPQEFEGFDIPEPDPLPETPSGIPAYRRQFR